MHVSAGDAHNRAALEVIPLLQSLRGSKGSGGVLCSFAVAIAAVLQHMGSGHVATTPLQPWRIDIHPNSSNTALYSSMPTRRGDRASANGDTRGRSRNVRKHPQRTG